MAKRDPDHDLNERVSLHDPDPEAVLRALLMVDPDDLPEEAATASEEDGEQ